MSRIFRVFLECAEKKNRSICDRKSSEGKEETAAVSTQLYKTMTDHVGTALNKPETAPEVLHVYDKMSRRRGRNQPA